MICGRPVAMRIAGVCREREYPMRYVIVAAACGFFLAWDIVFNHSEYIERGVSLIHQAARWAGV